MRAKSSMQFQNQFSALQLNRVFQLPARYKFELDRLNALVYFMPFDVIEYSATNSAVVLRAALSQLENFDNWRAIVTLIVKEAYKAVRMNFFELLIICTIILVYQANSPLQNERYKKAKQGVLKARVFRIL